MCIRDRVVTGTRKFDHITPVLRDLHWLPVRQRIKYKLAMIVYKCLHGWAPTYLADDCLVISTIAGKRHLRSAGTGLLFVPRTRTTLGMRSFAVAGPVTWNSLPDTLRTATLSSLTFAGHLKTHLFGLPRERVWGLFNKSTHHHHHHRHHHQLLTMTVVLEWINAIVPCRRLSAGLVRDQQTLPENEICWYPEACRPENKNGTRRQRLRSLLRSRLEFSASSWPPNFIVDYYYVFEALKAMHCVSKNQYTWLLIIISANVDRFSKFFHSPIPKNVTIPWPSILPYLCC